MCSYLWVRARAEATEEAQVLRGSGPCAQLASGRSGQPSAATVQASRRPAPPSLRDASVGADAVGRALRAAPWSPRALLDTSRAMWPYTSAVIEIPEGRSLWNVTERHAFGQHHRGCGVPQGCNPTPSSPVRRAAAVSARRAFRGSQGLPMSVTKTCSSPSTTVQPDFVRARCGHARG